MLRIVTPRFVVAVLVALLSWSAVAHAAPMDKRELEARADFAAGRYQKAVDAFAALFADTADPVYLRNIARCYQKMRRPQEAIDSFQEYLHKAKSLSKGERQEIEGYIQEMETLKASEQAATPVAPAPATGPPPAVIPPEPAPLAAAPTPAPTLASPVTPLQTAAPAPASDGRGWRTAGIVTAAGGVVLIGVGIAYGAAAKGAADSVSQQYSASTESAGKRDVTLQWVGYGVGAAAVAAGAFLYLYGPSLAGKPPEATAGLHGGATFNQNGGAVTLEGAF
ncbi:MAG TPA: tetratricopeptide repeat protein [Polyangia bacterium]|jgi:tetratricopeptide (TPR) repeat protein